MENVFPQNMISSNNQDDSKQMLTFDVDFDLIFSNNQGDSKQYQF